MELCGFCIEHILDTTISNTGHFNAASSTLQEISIRASLWSACLHLASEVILMLVFIDLNAEASKSGEYMIFGRFKKHFTKYLMEVMRLYVHLTRAQ